MRSVIVEPARFAKPPAHRPVRAAVAALALLTATCAPLAAHAGAYPDAHWRGEFAITGASSGGLGSLGSFVGEGGGASGRVTVFPPHSHFGMTTRSFGTHFAERRTEDATTDWLGNDVVQTVTSWHSLSWVGLGVAWRERVGNGHAELYALAGSGTFGAHSLEGEGWLSSEPFALRDRAVDAWMLGACWMSAPRSGPWILRDLSLEVGVDLLLGDRVAAFQDPPGTWTDHRPITSPPRHAGLALATLHGGVAFTVPRLPAKPRRPR